MSVVGLAIAPQLYGHGFRRRGAFQPLGRESGLGPMGAVSRQTEVAPFISLGVRCFSAAVRRVGRVS